MIARKCPFCEKNLEGFTDKQVEHYLKQHILARHPEKIKFKNLLK